MGEETPSLQRPTDHEPQPLSERLARCLTLHAHPALEPKRWSRPEESPVHPAAVAVAWDLVTQQAAAEANLLNRAMAELETEPERVLLAASVAAGARRTSVGGLCVVAKDGRRWWPRDLSFIPGREHPTPELSVHYAMEVDRNVFPIFLRRRYTAYLLGDEEQAPEERRVERTMGVLLTERHDDERSEAELRRDREVELAVQAEGHLLERVLVSDLWRDPVGCAEAFLTRLDEACRRDVQRS